MAEILEDIKTSIIEVTDDLGINLTANNPQILHSGTGIFTIQSTGLTSDINITTNNNITLSGGLVSSIQGITNNSAISLTTLITTFDTTLGTLSSTLADGTVGQMKVLVGEIIAPGTTALVTPITTIGYSALAFNASGDSATILYTSNGWVVINERNISFI